MEKGEENESRKRSCEHGEGVSPSSKKQSGMPEEEKKIDAELVQYQNRRLVQELKARRLEIEDLYTLIEGLRKKQNGYDETLITVNRAWNQLVEDLEIIASQYSSDLHGRKQLTSGATSKGNGSLSFPHQVFLQRLMEAGIGEKDKNSEISEGLSLESKLLKRKAETKKILNHLLETIQSQKRRSDEQFIILKNNLQSKDSAKIYFEREEAMKKELEAKQKLLEDLQLQLKESKAENFEQNDKMAKAESEIQTLKSELDEASMKIESFRRKIASFGEKDPFSVPSAFQGKLNLKQNGKVEKEGKIALEQGRKEDSHGAELLEAQKNQISLLQRIKTLELELSEERRFHSSRTKSVLEDQILLLREDLTKYRLTVESYQRERDVALLREKEAQFKADAGEAAIRAAQAAEEKIRDLELKLRECSLERDAFEQRLEQIEKAQAPEDTVRELKAMVSTLKGELTNLHESMARYKEMAQETIILRAEVHSLTDVSTRKSQEISCLKDEISSLSEELKKLKEENNKLRDSEEDLMLFLDMFERESVEKREISEVKTAEKQALVEIERLKRILSEHKITQKTKEFQEIEDIWNSKLSEAQVEIQELQESLDASRREIFELKETVGAKNEEGETYLSEIETLGQAYNEMQAQNRKLLQVLLERDNFQDKLRSEAVKARQLQSSLISEKESMAAEIKTLNGICESHKNRADRMEEQAKGYLQQLAQNSTSLRQQGLQLESTKVKLQQTEHELKVLKISMEEADKEMEERGKRLAEAEAILEGENLLWKKGDQEGGIKSIQKLNEELQLYKKYLQCPVCELGTKEVIITKCFHLFCDQCIKSNLEARNRKCPICKVGFGQSDVRRVFM